MFAHIARCSFSSVSQRNVRSQSRKPFFAASLTHSMQSHYSRAVTSVKSDTGIAIVVNVPSEVGFHEFSARCSSRPLPAVYKRNSSCTGTDPKSRSLPQKSRLCTEYFPSLCTYTILSVNRKQFANSMDVTFPEESFEECERGSEAFFLPPNRHFLSDVSVNHYQVQMSRLRRRVRTQNGPQVSFFRPAVCQGQGRAGVSHTNKMNPISARLQGSHLPLMKSTNQSSK